MAYCRIGTSPDGSSTWFLPRTVGAKKAMELALLGDRFGAREAERLGIVNRVVSPHRLEEETEALARRLAAGPARALANTKRLLRDSGHASLEEQLQAEAEMFCGLCGERGLSPKESALSSRSAGLHVHRALNDGRSGSRERPR